MNVKKTKTQTFVIALAMIITLTIGSTPGFGQKRIIDPPADAGNDLVGVWEAVAVPAHNDCKTDAPLGSLINASHTFNQGGTMYVEDTLSIDRYRTTGSGIWKRTSGRNYTYLFFHYAFDPNGNFLFTVKGRSNLTLSRNGNSFTERGTFELIEPGGNVIYAGCFNSTSHRVTF